MEKHIVTRQSLLNIQVCSEGTYDEALDFVRLDSPAGTRGNWFKIKRSDKNWKTLKPCACLDHPKRKHYVFEC